MNCELCQDRLSVFLDNELDPLSASEVREHLAVCAECSAVCEDLAMIIDFSHLETEDCELPPNPQALWCRINNIIESEVRAETLKDEQARAQQTQENTEGGWLPRRWNFSFMQIASAVLGIAVISSVLTIVAIRNYQNPGNLASVSAPQSLFERALAKVGLIESARERRERVIKEREAVIAHWNKRVEERRAQWNVTLRDAFDRNLREIDQAVHELTVVLEENPQDELSGEMLDSALDDKMELLRAFSEL